MQFSHLLTYNKKKATSRTLGDPRTTVWDSLIYKKKNYFFRAVLSHSEKSLAGLCDMNMHETLCCLNNTSRRLNAGRHHVYNYPTLTNTDSICINFSQKDKTMQEQTAYKLKAKIYRKLLSCKILISIE